MNKMFGGEAMLAQLFTGPGEVLLADPVFPGKVAEVQLEVTSDGLSDILFLKKGSHVDEHLKFLCACKNHLLLF